MPAHGTVAADGDAKAPSSPPGTPPGPPDGLRSPDGLLPLDELMPWSVRPLRTGRAWVSGPDPVALRARWERLAAACLAEQERLFAPTRSRTPHTSVAALPGRSAGTGRFARTPGPCPDPVRILHGPYDEQWLLPDHRLIDAARPELWRVADGRQLFAVEHSAAPGDSGPALSVTALLPDGHSPAGAARPDQAALPQARRHGTQPGPGTPGAAARTARRRGGAGRVHPGGGAGLGPGRRPALRHRPPGPVAGRRGGVVVGGGARPGADAAPVARGPGRGAAPPAGRAQALCAGGPPGPSHGAGP